jgi:hypothetical protein
LYRLDARHSASRRELTPSKRACWCQRSTAAN